MEKLPEILVPIDFSACSENALVFAMQLADKIKANLRLLTVLHFEGSDMENTAYAVDEIQERKVQAKIRMINFIEKVTEEIRASLDETPTTQISIEIGKVTATICDVADRKQVDYIIMGTQGENSTLDKYIGSTASNVLRDAPCSVIVIPEKTDLAKKVRIGYATDFLDADPFEIWKALNLFQPFEPKLKCVHFNGQEENSEGKIKEIASFFAKTIPELEIDFFNLPIKDKVKDMNDFVENENINMLVMYKPNRSFFESIFHNSYTQRMAKHTNIPLMVLKESE